MTKWLRCAVALHAILLTWFAIGYGQTKAPAPGTITVYQTPT